MGTLHIMTNLLYQFIWSLVFAENAVFPIIYTFIGDETMRLGLDISGFMQDNGISFSNVENIVYLFAIQFLILKFVKKLIDVYGLQTDGDPNADIVTLIINFCKAMVIAMAFTIIWSWIYDIVYDFTKQIIDSIGVLDVRNIYQNLKTSTEGNTASYTFLLDPLILAANGILMLLQMKNGLDLWILRIGMPLACVGLMDSDQGIFKQYCRLMTKCILTIIVQTFFINASLYVLAMANQTNVSLVFFIISIAMIIAGFKTPKILGELLVPQQPGGGGKIMQAVYMGSILFRG